MTRDETIPQIVTLHFKITRLRQGCWCTPVVPARGELGRNSATDGKPAGLYKKKKKEKTKPNLLTKQPNTTKIKTPGVSL